MLIEEAERPEHTSTFCFPSSLENGPANMQYRMVITESALEPQLGVRWKTAGPSEALIYISSNAGFLPIISRSHYAPCEKLPEKWRWMNVLIKGQCNFLKAKLLEVSLMSIPAKL